MLEEILKRYCTCFLRVEGLCGQSLASGHEMPPSDTHHYTAAQAFDAVKERTSIVPFQAIWEGRQKLPREYYKEWLRLPYVTILAVTLGTYWAHPLMQSASHLLNW